MKGTMKLMNKCAVVKHIQARNLVPILIAGLAAAAYLALFGTDLKYTLPRHEMVRNHIFGRELPDRTPVTDEAVLAAMRRVPRHEFVPADAKHLAYDDRPLQIGHGRTISQPYIVAFMAELLKLKPDDRVLEIGAGSGYEAAVLSEIAGKVYSIALDEAQAVRSARRLDRLNYTRVHIKPDDSHAGWEEHAPYDAVFVRGSVPEIPPMWKEQLRAGGRMVVPVGLTYAPQDLVLVKKEEDGTCHQRRMMVVRFTPLSQPSIPEGGPYPGPPLGPLHWGHESEPASVALPNDPVIP